MTPLAAARALERLPAVEPQRLETIAQHERDVAVASGVLRLLDPAPFAN